MAFKFLGQRQLGKLPSRWVSTILMVAIVAFVWVVNGKPVWGRQGFRLVVPKCARFQRLRRAAGCFGEIAATPNPGRGLRFLVSRAVNRHWPQPHHYAAVKNRGLTA